MKSRLEPKVGGIRTLVRGLAENGSTTGRWSEQEEQVIRLERGGSVVLPDFDTITATFEAIKYKDERQRLRTLYLARIAGSQELVSEELSDDLRMRLTKATAAVSISEMIIMTDSMSMEPDEDGDPMDFTDEESYRHTQTVEYRINGNGEILECVRSDEYTCYGETALAVHYSEPYRRGKLVVDLFGNDQHDSSPNFVGDNQETLQKELAVDVALFEQLEHFRTDKALLALSREEHEQRIFAILAFITMQGDVKESLQIALS